MKLLAIFWRPKPTPTPTAPAKTASAPKWIPVFSRTIKTPTTSTTLAMIWAMAYWSARSNPLWTRKRSKRKRFVLEEIQKTATRSPISRKIWTRLNETAGKGALQAKGMPAALIALMVKKTSAARLRIVVTIATKFVSILKRLKKRLTALLCSIRAITSPVAKRMTKAINPRNVT